MTGHLAWLLSAVFDQDPLVPEHLEDLRRSGLTDVTIQRHHLRSIPPGMIGALLGFDVRGVRSAMLVPFPDPAGGFMNHVRMKVFPPLIGRRGHMIKYFQPRGSGVRLFFPLATLHEALRGATPLWCVEGEKKSLAVAQLGLPAVGVCGIEGWHCAGSLDLISDFTHVSLRGRVVELVPDGDYSTNANVRWGARRLADALRAVGARPRLVRLPNAG